MDLPRVFNLGSINVDHVYHLPHFVRPGESLSAESYARGPGGKGFNQSVALCRSGAPVTHIGKIGPDGDWLRTILQAEGADIRHIGHDGATGHAIIQVGPDGENAIVVHPGANREIRVADVRAALAEARPGDWFLCQHETTCVAEGLALAAERGLRTAWNPAPFHPAARQIPLRSLDWLIVNETEAAGLSGERKPRAALEALRALAPSTTVFLTLGPRGVLLAEPKRAPVEIPAAPANPVDTTAAGDTFIGYTLGAFLRRFPLEEAAKVGCLAAAAAVSKHGAADSIPRWGDLAF